MDSDRNHNTHQRAQNIATQDANHNLTETIVQNWSRGVWENMVRYTIKYNSLFQKELELEDSWNGHNWDENERTHYSYDSSDRLLEINEMSRSLDWEESRVVKYSYGVYDEERWIERILKLRHYDTAQIARPYPPGYIIDNYKLVRYLAIYNSNNRMTQIIRQNRSYAGWTNTERTANHYDQNDNLVGNLFQLWIDDKWLSLRLFHSKYDDDSKKLKTYKLIWRDSNWDSVSTNTFRYDEDGLLVEEYITNKGVWGVWGSKTRYEYDRNGKVIIFRTEKWEGEDELIVSVNTSHYEVDPIVRTTYWLN